MTTHPNHLDAKPASCSRRQALSLLAGSLATPTTLTSPTPPADGSSLKQRRLTGTNATKETAARDYQQSLAATQGRLASDPHLLLNAQPSDRPYEFDIAIIGSGYGGSICAARLAARLRPGAKLCVIERGREWIPGTYPDRFRDATGESMRSLIGLDLRTVKNPLGLLNVLQGEDISVLSGNALGGTSIINANVAIRPSREVYRQACWPALLQDSMFLEPYFDRAEWELGVQTEPLDLTAKMRIQRLAAENLRDLGAHFEASCLTVTRNPQWGLPILNRQGMIQRPCTNCGDCMTGCNVGAKNTLQMNYLPLARRAGAEIFTQTEIVRIENCQGHYQLTYRHFPAGLKKPVAIEGKIRARIVILAAGSVGSTEILLRSQSENFQFSPRLGANWSGNGDILGFVRGIDPPSQIGGVGSRVMSPSNPGPTIQGNILFPHQELRSQLCIQDGVAAKSFANIMGILFRDLNLDHSHLLLTCGHDGAHGHIVLDQDSPTVLWPNSKLNPYREIARNAMSSLAQSIGGSYQELKLFRGKVGTVHPLGGCSMSDDVRCGVVNHQCQVYSAMPSGPVPEGAVFPGLYVADGAVLPTSLGVNPMATISAIAERTAELMVNNPSYQDLFSRAG